MSFFVKTPQLPASTAQEAAQFSTYRESDPVPMGYGRDRFASRWICQPYAWQKRDVAANQPQMEICSIAAQYRDGPVNFIGRIWANGREVENLDYTFGGAEESHEFALPGLGLAARAIVHRGTETAIASATLAAGTGQAHPPYRGRCWIEWIDLDLGQGTTAVPDLHVELGRHTPAIGAYAAGDSMLGVNPFAAIYALLRDEAVFGLPAEYLEEAHWAAQCAALEATGVADRSGALVHCHPVFKSAQDAAALLSTILAHVDGYLYAEGGKFKVGWFPSQAPAGGLPEITEHDLEAAPSGTSFPDWNRGAGAVVVIYRDVYRDYNDTPALCPAPANRETGLAATPARVERPMIHLNTADDPQAAMIAAEIAASRASAEATVTLPVMKSRAVTAGGAPLMPGDLFAWDYGPHSLDLVMRVVGRRIRAGETADLIEAIPERGQFPLPYVAPADDRLLPTVLPPGEVTAADVRLWLLPSGFTELRKVAPLVDREHRGIYRVDLHLSTAGAAPWSAILDARFFPAKCAVAGGGVSGAAAVVRVTSTSVDFARMAAQDAVAQGDDTLCLLMGDEVCSVGSITVVAANTYDLAVLRGRRGTAAAAHGDGVVAWLFYRSELAAVEHAEFYRVRDGSNAYHAPTATKYFKLQLFTVDVAGLPKPDDPGISLQLPDLSADERAGYTIVLTNEAHTVACASDGTPNAGQLGAGSAAKTDVKVFRGGTALAPVAATPNSDQFSIALGSHTNATATKEDNDTVRADSLSADTGLVQVLVNVAGAFTVAKLLSLTKAKAGAPGTPGTPGEDGADGAPGPGLVFMGAYNAAQGYYKTASRVDVVSYGGNYYPAANAAKSGTATWGAPGGADWGAAFTNFRAVATALLLAEDATILKTLVMGDGVTANAGLIRSAGATAFGTGTGFWLGYDGTTPKFRVGNPAGAYLSWDGTNLAAQFGADGTQTKIADTYFLWGKTDLTAAYFLLEKGGAIAKSTFRGNAGGFVYQEANYEASLLIRNGGGAGSEQFQFHFDTSTARLSLGSAGTFHVGTAQVLGSRKAAVSAAPTDASGAWVTGDFSGPDAVDIAGLTTHFNWIDGRLNTLAARINDLRERMKATGGHGLIAD